MNYKLSLMSPFPNLEKLKCTKKTYISSSNHRGKPGGTVGYLLWHYLSKERTLSYSAHIWGVETSCQGSSRLEMARIHLPITCALDRLPDTWRCWHRSALKSRGNYRSSLQHVIFPSFLPGAGFSFLLQIYYFFNNSSIFLTVATCFYLVNSLSGCSPGCICAFVLRYTLPITAASGKLSRILAH